MSLIIVDTFLQDQQYRSILCLDGALPHADFFKTDLPIIAADGAANSLMKMGITPALVVGDLDGIDPSLLNQLKTLHVYDQNFCDYEKALDYLAAHDLLPCIVVGVGGGCLDHILNNINIFMRSKNVLYAPPLYGFVMNAGEHKSLTLPFNTKISLIGIPEARLTTTGLKWDLSNSKLIFPGTNSCFNRVVEENVFLEVLEGSVLVLIYL